MFPRAENLVQDIVRIGDQRKEDGISIPENAHLQFGISRADTQQLDPVAQIPGLKKLEQLIHGGRLFLTDGTVHAENLEDQVFAAEIRQGEGRNSGLQAEGVEVCRIGRRRKLHLRHDVPGQERSWA